VSYVESLTTTSSSKKWPAAAAAAPVFAGVFTARHRLFHRQGVLQQPLQILSKRALTGYSSSPPSPSDAAFVIIAGIAAAGLALTLTRPTPEQMALSAHPRLRPQSAFLCDHRHRRLRFHPLLPHLLALVSTRRLARSLLNLLTPAGISAGRNNHRIHHPRCPLQLAASTQAPVTISPAACFCSPFSAGGG
jgi:hypothetical protein